MTPTKCPSCGRWFYTKAELAAHTHRCLNCGKHIDTEPRGSAFGGQGRPRSTCSDRCRQQLHRSR